MDLKKLIIYIYKKKKNKETKTENRRWQKSSNLKGKKKKKRTQTVNPNEFTFVSSVQVPYIRCTTSERVHTKEEECKLCYSNGNSRRQRTGR